MNDSRNGGKTAKCKPAENDDKQVIDVRHNGDGGSRSLLTIVHSRRFCLVLLLFAYFCDLFTCYAHAMYDVQGLI